MNLPGAGAPSVWVRVAVAITRTRPPTSRKARDRWAKVGGLAGGRAQLAVRCVVSTFLLSLVRYARSVRVSRVHGGW